jgi:hypothetical protein
MISVKDVLDSFNNGCLHPPECECECEEEEEDRTATTADGADCQCPTDGDEGCISGIVTGTSKRKTVKLKRIVPRRPRVIMQVETDSNGCYVFTNLEPGKYKIKARGCRGGGKRIVDIAEGEKLNDVNFACKSRRR